MPERPVNPSLGNTVHLLSLLSLVVLLVLLVFPLGALAGPDKEDPERLLIWMDGGRLTVKATEVPQRFILEALAQRLGFELVVAGSLEERCSLKLDGEPWEEVLKKALSPTNWVFVYKPTGGGSRLAKVFVFPPKAEKASPSTSLPIPARVTPPPSPVPAQAAPGKETPLTPDQQERVRTMLTQLLDADDEKTQAVALFGLAVMGGEQAVEALTEALQDEEALIWETAAETLAGLGDGQAIQGLQQALQDEDGEVRQAAQEALGRLFQGSQ